MEFKHVLLVNFRSKSFANISLDYLFHWTDDCFSYKKKVRSNKESTSYCDLFDFNYFGSCKTNHFNCKRL